ncbi:hypothetical protein AAKU58_004327 [Oxalobacteraceae bacterium GrIS 1.18]
MRGHKTLIQEAEALAMAPAAAYDFLQKRSKQTKDEARYDAFDDEAEAALLARKDPLTNLGLAQFCRNMETAKALFEGAPPDSPVRLAVLTNTSLTGAIFRPLPVGLFPDHESAGTWIGKASYNELQALFENPSLADSFLRDILERPKPWQFLDDDRLATIVGILVKNPRMRTPREDDYMDGYAEYSYGAVFNAAWKLAETVEPDDRWSMALGWLYDQMQTDAFSIKEPMAILSRWRADPSNQEAVEEEAKENTSGWLSNKQRVRKGLARLALSKSSKLLPELLASEDIALRCAAYACGKITPEQAGAGYEKDGETFYNEAMHNLALWRTDAGRQALKTIAWSVVNNDKHSDLSAANIYNSIEKDKRKAHPDWFKDSDEAGSEMEQGDGPATKGDLLLLAARLEQPTANLVQQLGQAISKLNSRVGWVWWFSLGALVASLRHF